MSGSEEKEREEACQDVPHALDEGQPNGVQHQDSAPPVATEETEKNESSNNVVNQNLQESLSSPSVENGKESEHVHTEQQEPQPSSIADPGAHVIPHKEAVENNVTPAPGTLCKSPELASDAKPTEPETLEHAKPIGDTVLEVSGNKADDDGKTIPAQNSENVTVPVGIVEPKAEIVEIQEPSIKVEETKEENKTTKEAVDENEMQSQTNEVDDNKTKASEVVEGNVTKGNEAVKENEPKANETVEGDETKANDTLGENDTKANDMDIEIAADNDKSRSKQSFLLDNDHMYDGSESGTEEDQVLFMRELENFFRERSMDFKPPKFYGEGLNCLKLWRAVMRLGGYDKVTSCKLWRQVGESFRPPKTCTTVSWTFRGFYEKALLDYERHKTNGGDLGVPAASPSEPASENQGSGSGRARRDAAARAMQGWHSQRLLGNGEVSDPIIKDKNSMPLQKREKQLKSIGLLKRKKPSYEEHVVKASRTKISKPQLDVAVVDLGPPADWVKINVQKTKDCFEVYALVPGLLREEVRVQSDPAGRLVISGDPEHTDNPWGVMPFKKVVSLPSRIDPHQTSAVVTLHGQLFVRVPFEQTE